MIWLMVTASIIDRAGQARINQRSTQSAVSLACKRMGYKEVHPLG